MMMLTQHLVSRLKSAHFVLAEVAVVLTPPNITSSPMAHLNDGGFVRVHIYQINTLQ